MAWLSLCLLLVVVVRAQPADDHRAVIAELGRQADIFERNAYRLAGIETFRQTVPSGVRTSRSLRGVEVRLPGLTREIVSEYGFLTEDVRGGSLREVRMVLTVDGLRWKRGTKGLETLSKELAVRDDKGRKQQLEDWENYGLSGFITDLGQLILLFARGNAKLYDIRFLTTEGEGADQRRIYTYEQKDGGAALTVHGEAEQAKRELLKGRIWVRTDDRMPVRISLESDRKDSKGVLRDIATVSYFVSSFGTLLPVQIVHEQFGDDQLLVKNEFTYSNFKQILRPARKRW